MTVQVTVQVAEEPVTEEPVTEEPVMEELVLNSGGEGRWRKPVAEDPVRTVVVEPVKDQVE